MTTNTILIIAVIVIGIIIAVKFVRFIIKWVVLLAVLAIAIMLFMNMTKGTAVPSITNMKVQTTAGNVLNNITKDFKQFNFSQAESNFQSLLNEGIGSVKQTFAMSKIKKA
jgi:dolichyl-phosphate-mannose--protein O-mannosyl transferase